MERGIVLETIERSQSGKWSVNGPSIDFEQVTTVDPFMLRQAALYWDQINLAVIDCPESIFDSPEADFLAQTGMLSKTGIEVNAAMASMLSVPYFRSRMVLGAYRVLEKVDPGAWTMGHCNMDDYVPEEMSCVRETIEVSLNQVLPTPPGEVALQDILELRQKYQAELIGLRFAVDELVDDALKSANLPRAHSAALHRLQQAISDIRRIAKPSWLSGATSRLSFSFTVPQLIVGFAGGTTASAQVFGLPQSNTTHLISGLAGALASCIRFEVKNQKVFSTLPDSAKNFGFLYHVEKQFPGTL